LKNSNKHILIVSSEFPPLPGGIGNHAFNLGMQLHNAGFKVEVLTNYRAKEKSKEDTFDISIPLQIYRISQRKYLKRIWQYCRLRKENNYWTVIATGKFSLWMVGVMQLFFSSKNLAIVHGSELLPTSIKNKIVTNFSLSKFNKIIAVSDFTKNLLHDKFKSKTEVITNGYNSEVFSPNNQNFTKNKSKKLHLITVGAVSQRKGQHNVISKLPELIEQYPNIQYHIVGIPTEKERLILLATKLKVIDHITFYGELPQKELLALLIKSDIFVMLSENTANGEVEGFGIAILEANALGIPVVGSTGCGIESAIKNNYSGSLIDAASSTEFLFAIKGIIENYNEYSVNSKTWAKLHTWEKVGEKYAELIDQL
jgi:phosphatidylinositol alpha-1,6-mannosyltransferase